MRTSANQTNVTVGTTSGQLVGPNQNRRALVISSPVTNRITLSWAGAAVLDRGITLYPNDPPLELTYDKWGDAIGQPITAIADAAPESLAVIEIQAAP